MSPEGIMLLNLNQYNDIIHLHNYKNKTFSILFMVAICSSVVSINIIALRKSRASTCVNHVSITDRKHSYQTL